MTGWDLKDGYHHILINEKFREYLGFKLTLEGKIVYCRYKVGPFGLRDLPWLFSKIFRVLVKRWRGLGLKTIKFLDDGINFSNNVEEAKRESALIRADLHRAGAIYSVKKSEWVPTQKVQWLGYVWDSSIGHISIADHRIEKIISTCTSLLSNSQCHIKSLASFVGQIISTLFITGNIAKLMTRFSQQRIASEDNWDSVFCLDEDIKNELIFWRDNIKRLNNWFCKGMSKPSIVRSVYSDASDSGCGAVLMSEDSISARLFSPEERLFHSTRRELLGGLHALQSFLPSIRGSFVKLHLDNQSSARIIECGSMKKDLHAISIEIFELCFENKIELSVEWIPRLENEAADLASRSANILDVDDWQITPNFFSIIDRKWGPITIDAFANSYNTKTKRFYSLFHSPHCEGVNAFAYDWSQEMCLLVPPVSVVGKVLNHLLLCKAKAVLVVPDWKSSYFYPLIMKDYRDFVKDSLTAKGIKVLIHGHNKNSLLGSNSFQGNILAFLIDCSQSLV